MLLCDHSLIIALHSRKDTFGFNLVKCKTKLNLRRNTEGIPQNNLIREFFRLETDMELPFELLDIGCRRIDLEMSIKSGTGIPTFTFYWFVNIKRIRFAILAGLAGGLNNSRWGVEQEEESDIYISSPGSRKFLNLTKINCQNKKIKSVGPSKYLQGTIP